MLNVPEYGQDLTRFCDAWCIGENDNISTNMVASWFFGLLPFYQSTGLPTPKTYPIIWPLSQYHTHVPHILLHTTE